jgi:acid phosphatase (class A)
MTIIKRHPVHIAARTGAMLLALAALAFATASAAPKERFFTGEAEDLAALIPPPPPDDSPAGLADLETVLQVQRDRTPAQVERAARAQAYGRDNALALGARVFGPEFTAANLPRTAAVLRQADEERHAVGSAVKARWNRPRPYVRDARVEPCVPRSRETSYPSGHSAVAAVWAELLGAAVPEYRARFLEEAREAMWSRVLAGMHYPTDTQAGGLLGRSLAGEMLKNKTTRDAVGEMRAEILAFLEKHPDAKARAAGAGGQGCDPKRCPFPRNRSRSLTRSRSLFLREVPRTRTSKRTRTIAEEWTSLRVAPGAQAKHRI